MEEQLTRQQAIAEHRKMWNWIAEECLKRKEKVEKIDYFLENYIEDFNVFKLYAGENLPDNLCWCCDYANRQLFEHSKFNRFSCGFCPILWGGAYGCASDSSPYVKFINLDFSEYGQASILARAIANLPERPTEEWDYVETPE